MSFDIRTTEYGKISASFSQASLAKLCVEKIGVQTGPFGSQLHNEDYVAVGTPIITVEHLGENRIIHQSMPYVSDEDKARLSKYCLQKGDIVFSRVGSVDRRALVRQEEDGWLFSGRCLRVRVDKAKIDPVYLSYFFGLEGFKNYIKSIAVGATMPSINTKILSDVPIYFPELEKQKKIGKILQELDDKIELSRQINQTLEAMAKAIFKSWFVDFEPVKAKISAIEAGEDSKGTIRAAMSAISGKTDEELDQFQVKQPEHYTQLETTANLFPSSMQNSELGEIPLGWKVGKLKNYSNLIIRGFTSKYVEKSNLINLNQKVNRGVYLDKSNYKYYIEGIKVPEEKFAKKKDILINSLGQGTLGRVHLFWEDVNNIVIDQHITIVRTNNVSLYPEYLYTYLSYRETQDRLESLVTGTTGMLMLNVSKIRDFPILVPDENIQKTFSKIVSDFYSQKYKNNMENEALSQLCDALLPKLISGELSVDTLNLEEEN